MGADLIVVGSHGYGRLRRLMLGSVASAVVANAPCSVQVVRNKQAFEDRRRIMDPRREFDAAGADVMRNKSKLFALGAANRSLQENLDRGEPVIFAAYESSARFSFSARATCSTNGWTRVRGCCSQGWALLCVSRSTPSSGPSDMDESPEGGVVSHGFWSAMRSRTFATTRSHRGR